MKKTFAHTHFKWEKWTNISGNSPKKSSKEQKKEQQNVLCGIIKQESLTTPTPTPTLHGPSSTFSRNSSTTHNFAIAAGPSARSNCFPESNNNHNNKGNEKNLRFSDDAWIMEHPVPYSEIDTRCGFGVFTISKSYSSDSIICPPFHNASSLSSSTSSPSVSFSSSSTRIRRGLSRLARKKPKKNRLTESFSNHGRSKSDSNLSLTTIQHDRKESGSNSVTFRLEVSESKSEVKRNQKQEEKDREAQAFAERITVKEETKLYSSDDGCNRRKRMLLNTSYQEEEGASEGESKATRIDEKGTNLTSSIHKYKECSSFSAVDISVEIRGPCGCSYSQCPNCRDVNLSSGKSSSSLFSLRSVNREAKSLLSLSLSVCVCG